MLLFIYTVLEIACVNWHHTPSIEKNLVSIVICFAYSGGVCGCSDWHGCIMRASVIGEDGIQPYKFSTCSKNQFFQWMRRSPGTAQCLLNKPNQVWSLAQFSLLLFRPWWGVTWIRLLCCTEGPSQLTNDFAWRSVSFPCSGHKLLLPKYFFENHLQPTDP